MIEKILDKYYAKKLKEKMEYDLSLYYVDKYFKFTNNLLELYIKDRKWKETEYILVMAIPFSECFEKIVNYKYKDLIERVDYLIDEKINKR